MAACQPWRVGFKLKYSAVGRFGFLTNFGLLRGRIDAHTPLLCRFTPMQIVFSRAPAAGTAIDPGRAVQQEIIRNRGPYAAAPIRSHAAKRLPSPARDADPTCQPLADQKARIDSQMLAFALAILRLQNRRKEARYRLGEYEAMRGANSKVVSLRLRRLWQTRASSIPFIDAELRLLESRQVALAKESLALECAIKAIHQGQD